MDPSRDTHQCCYNTKMNQKKKKTNSNPCQITKSGSSRKRLLQLYKFTYKLLINCSTYQFQHNLSKTSFGNQYHDRQKTPINDIKCYNHRIETMHISLHKHYCFWYQHWLIVPLAQDILQKSFIHKVPSHLVLGPLVIGVLMLN